MPHTKFLHVFRICHKVPIWYLKTNEQRFFHSYFTIVAVISGIGLRVWKVSLHKQRNQIYFKWGLLLSNVMYWRVGHNVSCVHFFQLQAVINRGDEVNASTTRLSGRLKRTDSAKSIVPMVYEGSLIALNLTVLRNYILRLQKKNVSARKRNWDKKDIVAYRPVTW
jgi:hypothetical protein